MTIKILRCDEIANLDFEATINLIESICLSGKLEVMHPISNKATCCVASAQRGISNILKFCDANGLNVWYLIQISSFIDAWVCNDEFHCYELSPTVKGTTKKIPRWIESGIITFESHPPSERQITGILVSGNRPYHYLHDRYIYAAELSLKHNLAAYCFRNRKCFIKELPTPSGQLAMQSRPSKGCFIAPCIRKDQLTAKHLNQVASFLTCTYAALPSERFEGITLWLGISSQTNRRMWLEQVEGYISYINFVSERTKKAIRIFIDGWTSYAENPPKEAEIESDEALAHQLITAFERQSSVTVISLIGLNYPEKIARALVTDLAITNDCSGSLITHTLCRLPCIMHGNKVIRSYPEQLLYPLAKLVDYKLIQTIPGPKPSNTDYSMPWQLLIPGTEEILSSHFLTSD
ncbi:hypothetical protein [uncultured Umboniibacter sp.]|uniref:hypothetical protein n=1 Tax=uncultured Umboniibacter sp. TaxID=1798917 RepID=UPI0026159CEC|nr:hypothetical protein [uncultured Umboniibacter sp.]